MSEILEKTLFVIVMVGVISLGNRLSGVSKSSASLDQNFAGVAERVNSVKEPLLFALTSGAKIPAYENSSATDATSSPKSSVSGTLGFKPSIQPPGFLQAISSPNEEVFHSIRQNSPPAITAEGALVADLTTGEAYFEIKKDGRWPVASLTKLMTAVKTLKDIDTKRSVTLGPNDFPPEDTAPKSLKIGDVYSAGDLLKAALMVSSNEASEALANAYGRADFIAGLNTQAKEWGMESTNFSDPTGLSSANQSTPEDLRKLALNVYQNYQEIFEITRKAKSSIKEVNSRKLLTLSNINLYAGQTGFIGGKTGFTDEAGGNLLTVFSYRARPVIVIVLGTSDRFGETDRLISWFKSNHTR